MNYLKYLFGEETNWQNEVHWQNPVEGYHFEDMSDDELKEVAKAMIEELDQDNPTSITYETTNYDGLVNELKDYLKIPEAVYQKWAKKFVEEYFVEGSKEFETWTTKLIDFWKAQEKVPPMISYNYSDDGTSRKGFIANATNIFFKKPEEWKTAIKFASKTK